MRQENLIKTMDIKKSAKQAGIGLLYSILLIQLFRWLRPTIIITGMILVGISVIWMIAKKNFSWKKLLKSIITISIILTIFRYAGFLGIAGIFGAIILVALFMLYARREAFKEAI